MPATATTTQVAIDRIHVSAYKIPTDQPEADGTIAWDSTTLVLVEIEGGGHTGLGYTYADEATAHLIHDNLTKKIEGRDVMNIPGTWVEMVKAIRNLGRPGVASMAISAVDCALWDLKCRLVDLPLLSLLGAAHDSVPIYGSGGFTSYANDKLQQQLGGWAEQGISRVKMKIGTHPDNDLNRVRAARKAVGEEVELFVDANGAFSRKQALAFAHRLHEELGVVWFEEPVSSDDLAGLNLIRNQGPGGMDIAAGEYGYDLHYFHRMLDAEAVDVLQADVTRCGGVTSFLQVGALCSSHCLELSAHCAPSESVHACAAIIPLRPMEYFHDHVRIEHMLFDGVLSPEKGALHPDLSRPGMGLEFKHADAERYLIWKS
ncbi:MAG TPA: enolase C-terminal domain-like protein [Gemmataceae bacterium]|nr:enolase C-terminal domain-like protein [Gemmataceae bacterium]